MLMIGYYREIQIACFSSERQGSSCLSQPLTHQQ
ncbi:hypothetical protein DAI22_09g052100 [Oryza sativa Japonica Group]|nr:hypothetical protein DAI22_09g052100 [Oryza sativa Japonica Group]